MQSNTIFFQFLALFFPLMERVHKVFLILFIFCRMFSRDICLFLRVREWVDFEWCVQLWPRRVFVCNSIFVWTVFRSILIVYANFVPLTVRRVCVSVRNFCRIAILLLFILFQEKSVCSVSDFLSFSFFFVYVLFTLSINQHCY